MKIVPLIFAAGKGARLRPLTYNTPKPLLSIKNGQSILDFNISKLAKYGFRKLFITTSYAKDQFEKLKDKYKSSIEIVLLELRTNTGGHIAPLRDSIGLFKGIDMLLSMNGDTFVDFDLDKLLTQANRQVMAIIGSENVSTIPKQLICEDNKLVGIKTCPPHFYINVKKTVKYCNNIGLYLIPTNFLKLTSETKGFLGIFGKNDLVDIAINKNKCVEWVNITSKSFWSFNTLEELRYVRSNFSEEIPKLFSGR